ncbi:lactonase family protein [Allorhizocola rhizosphaerae]|uniref:lactonase family protein n=1 Tax=Allorhizocola rhizosphaerae TaxID=1872709 RepID=UPI0013C34B46|nr:beta-propeller fold lactonase family protein [Allorhizocola rhizosphaerae]
MSVYVGSYGLNILRFDRDPSTGMLTGGEAVAQLPNASWLEWHRDTLYAVSETSTGSVAAFKDGVVPLGQQPSHGGAPCHLAIDPSGSHLLVANYGGGSIAVLPIEPDGSLAPASDAVRLPAGAHAHQVVFDRGAVFVPDLGHDAINQYTLDDGRLTQTGAMRAPQGCGPRHLVIDGDGYRFVAAELGSLLLVFDPDNNLAANRGATVSHRGENHPSGLTFSPDRRFIYLANRGPNCVSVFAVDGPEVTPVEDVPCGGDWPRDITFIDDMLYVANQRSGDIAIFTVDPATGIPAQIGLVNTPDPARVLAQ